MTTPTLQPLPDELAPPTLAQEAEFRLCWWIGLAVCTVAVAMFDVWHALTAARSWIGNRAGALVAAVRSGAGRIARARGA